jgi:site-specific DNA-methyltransferase (adenine-specific)
MTLELNRIYNMDCLDGMREIPDKSVDMILCDLPYGQTQNAWDSIIPLERLWNEYLRLIKQNTAVILFGQGMFTVEVMFSQRAMWRYNLIWEKGNRATGFLNAHKMPMRSHEDLLVFYLSLPTFNPQHTRGIPTHRRDAPRRLNNTYGDFEDGDQRNYGFEKFPKSVLKFDKPHPPIHPTEKPVALCEYLIRTYTNEGDLVLDNCIGSGTTAEACIRSGRQFIGFEKEKTYFDAAQIKELQQREREKK